MINSHSALQNVTPHLENGPDINPVVQQDHQSSTEDSHLPKPAPGQGLSSASKSRLMAKLTLLEPHKEKLDQQKDKSIEYQTGFAVALQTSEIAKKEKVPPLMLSFSEPALEAARDAAPHLPRVLNVDSKDLRPGWTDLLRKLDCVALDMDYEDITPDIIDTAHKAGFRIMCYTPNDPALIKKFFSWGIDNVITDMIHLVKPEEYQRWDKKEGVDTSAYNLPEWPYPEIVGHRFTGKTTDGEFRVGPENTMSAAAAAVAHNYKAVEYDVNITTDPIPVPFVMHDETLERTTDGEGAASRPWNELAKLKAGGKHSELYETEPIPTDLDIATYLSKNEVMRMVEIKPMPNDFALEK